MCIYARTDPDRREPSFSLYSSLCNVPGPTWRTWNGTFTERTRGCNIRTPRGCTVMARLSVNARAGCCLSVQNRIKVWSLSLKSQLHSLGQRQDKPSFPQHSFIHLLGAVATHAASYLCPGIVWEKARIWSGHPRNQKSKANNRTYLLMELHLLCLAQLHCASIGAQSIHTAHFFPFWWIAELLVSTGNVKLTCYYYSLQSNSWGELSSLSIWRLAIPNRSQWAANSVCFANCLILCIKKIQKRKARAEISSCLQWFSSDVESCL